ncbi:MAG: hypothetical protein V4478_03430 [Patescibacteria group bacterium]
MLEHQNSKTFQNLSTIIEQLEANRAAYTMIRTRRSFEALAKKYNNGYVPNIMEGIFGNKALAPDPIHPN